MLLLCWRGSVLMPQKPHLKYQQRYEQILLHDTICLVNLIFEIKLTKAKLVLKIWWMWPLHYKHSRNSKYMFTQFMQMKVISAGLPIKIGDYIIFSVLDIWQRTNYLISLSNGQSSIKKKDKWIKWGLFTSLFHCFLVLLSEFAYST